jgi:hypothetical protein
VIRARRWVARHRAELVALLVVGAAFAACYYTTVHYTPLFAPDSRYYAAMALWYGGGDQAEITRQVAQYSAQYGWASPGSDLLFGWGLVQPRVVLPALSVPFVAIWDIPGLAVVPGISLACLVGLLTVMVTRRYGAGAAIATMLLVVCSTQIVKFGAMMLTEGLSALWTALTVFVMWRYLRSPNKRYLVLMVVFTLLAAFTRQAGLITAGAFVVAWIGSRLLRTGEPWGLPALAVGASAVGAQVLQSLVFPFSQSNQFQAATGTDSLSEAILASPRLAWEIIRFDVIQAATQDRPVLILVGLAVVGMVIFWRRHESHLLLGALLGAGIYNVTNGTPTGIRYAMPGLVFFVLSCAVLISSAWHAGVRGPEGSGAGSPEPGVAPADGIADEADRRPRDERDPATV